MTLLNTKECWQRRLLLLLFLLRPAPPPVHMMFADGRRLQGGFTQSWPAYASGILTAACCSNANQLSEQQYICTTGGCWWPRPCSDSLRQCPNAFVPMCSGIIQPQRVLVKVLCISAALRSFVPIGHRAPQCGLCVAAGRWWQCWSQRKLLPSSRTCASMPCSP